MFFARICRHDTLWNRFQKLATRCSTANIAKKLSATGCYTRIIFRATSYRCKLTSVTPPLNVSMRTPGLRIRVSNVSIRSARATDPRFDANARRIHVSMQMPGLQIHVSNVSRQTPGLRIHVSIRPQGHEYMFRRSRYSRKTKTETVMIMLIATPARPIKRTLHRIVLLQQNLCRAPYEPATSS